MARRTSSLLVLLNLMLGGSSRRRQKGLIGVLLEGQAQTERKNGSHRGVMCGPGGSKKRR